MTTVAFTTARCLCGFLLCASLPTLTLAQQPAATTDTTASSWQENTVPDAPPLRLDALVTLPLPRHSLIELLVDRNSLNVTYPDGVVRFVAVLRGSNTQSALYQGIRCASDEVRTYARYDFHAQPPAWQAVNEGWRNISSLRTPYARAIARAGACENRVTTATSDQLRRRFGKQPQWDTH